MNLLGIGRSSIEFDLAISTSKVPSIYRLVLLRSNLVLVLLDRYIRNIPCPVIRPLNLVLFCHLDGLRAVRRHALYKVFSPTRYHPPSSFLRPRRHHLDNRLLATYRNGCVAVITDRIPDTRDRYYSCSVMDARGKCLLSVSGEGVATVLDRKGAVLWTGSYDNCCARLPITSASSPGSLLLAPLQLHSHPSAPAVSSFVSVDSRGDEQTGVKGLDGVGGGVSSSVPEQRWVIEGLTISFYASRWEVRDGLTRVFFHSVIR